MKEKGLTLIEVLVAIAIIAIAYTALLKSMATQVNNERLLQEKITAHWIGMQAIAKLQLGEINLSSYLPSTQSVQWLGQKYYYRIQASRTPIKNIQHIRVSISPSPMGPFKNPLDAYRFIPVLN
jgi:general secretion pathway protein I